MQAEHQQSWKLHIHTKLTNFHISLKINKLVLPSCKFFHFSTKFKIHNLLIILKSKPNTSFSSKINFFKYKLIQSIKKLQIRRSNKGITSRKWFTMTRTQGSNNGERSSLARELARFGESISRKDPNGIIKFGSIIVMFLCSRFYNYLRRKRLSILLVLVVGMSISGSIKGGVSYLSKAKAIVPLLEFISAFL